MERKLVFPKIDFADSTFISIEFYNDEAIVHIKNWEEKAIRVIFFNILAFTKDVCFFIKDVYELLPPDSLEENISKKFKNELMNNYKLYQILDIYDVPFIQLIAQNAQLIKDQI